MVGAAAVVAVNLCERRLRADKIRSGTTMDNNGHGSRVARFFIAITYFIKHIYIYYIFFKYKYFFYRVYLYRAWSDEK